MKSHPSNFLVSKQTFQSFHNFYQIASAFSQLVEVRYFSWRSSMDFSLTALFAFSFSKSNFILKLKVLKRFIAMFVTERQACVFQINYTAWKKIKELVVVKVWNSLWKINAKLLNKNRIQVLETRTYRKNLQNVIFYNLLIKHIAVNKH